MQITEDQEIIRTTPVQSPKSDRLLPTLPLHRRNGSSKRPPPTITSHHPKIANPTQPGGKKRSQVAFETSGPSTPVARPNQPSPEKVRGPKTALPSILKKPKESFRDGASSSSSGNPMTPPMSAMQDEEIMSSGLPILIEGAIPVTSPRDGGERPGQMSRRKKTATFIAGSASSARRRPISMRRKPSQSSYSSTSARSPTAPLASLREMSSTSTTIVNPSLPTDQSHEEAKKKGKERARESTTSPSAMRNRVASEPDMTKRRSKDGFTEANVGIVRMEQIASDDRGPGDRFNDRSSRDKHALSSIMGNATMSKTKPTLASTSTAVTGTFGLGESPTLLDEEKSTGVSAAETDEALVVTSGGRMFRRARPPEQDPLPTDSMARTKSQLTLLLERDKRFR